MLAKRIIACLDVKEGVVVKGTNFIGLKYAGEPAELSKRYASEGADEIVFLDISASEEGRKPNRNWIQLAAEQLNVPFTVGGGISTVDDAREVLSLGADKVAVNTAAINNPRLISDIAEKFGSQCVVVAIDCKREGNGWNVFSYGGSEATGKDAVEWTLECEKLGAGEILATSIERDGTGNGFDCKLTSMLADKLGIPIIASGGAGGEKDFLDAFTKGKADAALAAGIFHYGKLSIVGLKQYLKKNGVEVRA
jgi:cyclase